MKGPTGTTASLAREGIYMRCRVATFNPLLVDDESGVTIGFTLFFWYMIYKWICNHNNGAYIPTYGVIMWVNQWKIDHP